MSEPTPGVVHVLQVDRQANLGRVTLLLLGLLAWLPAELTILYLTPRFITSASGGNWLSYLCWIAACLVPLSLLSIAGLALYWNVGKLAFGRDEIILDSAGFTCRRVRGSFRHATRTDWSSVLNTQLSDDGKSVLVTTAPEESWTLTDFGDLAERSALTRDLRRWAPREIEPVVPDGPVPPYLPWEWRIRHRTRRSLARRPGLLFQKKFLHRLVVGSLCGILVVFPAGPVIEKLRHHAGHQDPLVWFGGLFAVALAVQALGWLTTSPAWLLSPGRLEVGRIWLITGGWVRRPRQAAALELGLTRKGEDNDSIYLCLVAISAHGRQDELLDAPASRHRDFRALGYWTARTAELPITDQTREL